MIIANKVYLPKVSYCLGDIYIQRDSYIDYSLENAIKSGLSYIKDEFYDIFEREPNDKIELTKFIHDYLTNFDFTIFVISGNRKIFDTSLELLRYFKDNIDKVSNEELYDFLLSLSEFDMLNLDEEGNVISNYIEPQSPISEDVVINEVAFSEESCKERKFKFSYNYMGIDTLHNSNSIKEINLKEE